MTVNDRIWHIESDMRLAGPFRVLYRPVGTGTGPGTGPKTLYTYTEVSRAGGRGNTPSLQSPPDPLDPLDRASAWPTSIINHIYATYVCVWTGPYGGSGIVRGYRSYSCTCRGTFFLLSVIFDVESA